jgi:NAD(P) transhydrogenase subunit beta
VYIVATVLFIMALRGLAHETTAKAGTVHGMLGMAIAIGGTMGTEFVEDDAYWIIVVAVIPAAIGGVVYAYTVETDRLPVSLCPASSFVTACEDHCSHAHTFPSISTGTRWLVQRFWRTCGST